MWQRVDGPICPSLLYIPVRYTMPRSEGLAHFFVFLLLLTPSAKRPNADCFLLMLSSDHRIFQLANGYSQHLVLILLN